jgi:hypothetical protein
MIQRYMFINSSGADVTVHVITQDAFVLFELVEAKPVVTPEEVKGEFAAGELDLTIPAGAIYGFATDHTASIKVPAAADFVMHATNGNVPWPEPPPSPNGLNVQTADFRARYRCFLDLAGEPEPIPALQVYGPAPVPAPASDVAREVSRKLDEALTLLRHMLTRMSTPDKHKANGSSSKTPPPT